MTRTSILQCPGMVCSPPVVSKCLGEAHRIYINYLDYLHYLDYLDYLDYIKSFFFFFFHTVGNLWTPPPTTDHFTPRCACARGVIIKPGAK